MSSRSAWMRVVAIGVAIAGPLGLWACGGSSPGSGLQSGIPNPDAVLGFQIGADRKLADWNEMVNYFTVLDQASDRVSLETIGETTMGKPMIMVTISSPATMARLGRFKEIQRKLADPRTVSAAEATALIAEAKPVVQISGAIHSNEIAATQEMLKLAYRLASEDTPQVREILDNVIVLLVPCINPDGHQMTVEWYKQTLGTPYEGKGTPYLNHKYAGGNLNRDWYMFSQKESQNIAKKMYREWFPEIVYDMHQMGAAPAPGARFFVPPYFDPPNPEIDPVIHREIMLLGGVITTDLAAKGLKGVVTAANFDSWKGGAMRDHVYYHNVVGILSEASPARLATPTSWKFEELDDVSRGLADPRQIFTNFPDPWPGGAWRLSDIMAYEESAAFSILKAAARFRDTFIQNFYDLGRRAIERGRTEAPYAYVVSAEQRDPATAAKMVSVLTFQGIQVHKAEEPFTADGKRYPAGSYVVLLAQPTRANVKLLLGRQTYPDRRESPGGPPERPYDIAGWTLWMLMGVPTDEIARPFEARLTEVKEVGPTAGMVAEGEAAYGYAFGAELNNAATARVRLIGDGFKLAWAYEPLKLGAVTLSAGATIVQGGSELHAKVSAIARELGISFYPLDAPPRVKARTLRLPRLGVYETWSGNADAGFTRFILEAFQIPFTQIRDRDLRSGKLSERFDAILIPDQPLAGIMEGNRPGSYPDEYVGGIGDQGAANLKTFVESGGTLITLNSAGDLAISKLGAPVKDALKGVKPTDFYCPGSVLAARVDDTQPVAFGMGPTADLYFVATGAAYQVLKGSAVVSYGGSNPLRSGWLLGSEKLLNKAAVVDVPVGRGKIIMFGFRPQFRAETYGTLKMVFNSIFYATTSDVRAGAIQ